MDREPVVRCESLVKVYESASGRVQAVRGIDLEFYPGANAALVGPSGCGKSSLLRMLAGLDRPTAGSVMINGLDLFEMSGGRRAGLRAALVTFIHQRPSENLIGHLTAAQQLDRVARGPKGDRSRVDEALEILGLGHRRDQAVSELSGGEQQRLALARAIVAGHDVVIADEPTAQLDRVAARATLDAMDLMKQRGMTVITATHDPRALDRMDQLIRLRDGAVSTVTESGTELSVIDSSGRLQLPPLMQARFPDRRVSVTFDEESGRIVIVPPNESGSARP